MITLRRFGPAAASALPWLALPALARAGAATPLVRLPANVPPGVGAILTATLQGPPEALNTDWFGTTLMDGVLRWSRRGVCDAREFATAWLDYQLRAGTVVRYQ